MDIQIFGKDAQEKEVDHELDEQLSSYLDTLSEIVSVGAYDVPESSILLPSDAQMHECVSAAVSWARRDSLKYVLVIGIGGSNLGTEALYQALGTTTGVRLLFLDTTSEAKMREIFAVINEQVTAKDEILINVISKSGTTTETIANFEILYTKLAEKFGDVSDRVVATTDKGSELWQVAEQNGFYQLDIPQQVGGRYSVLSAVGLFPLALAGVSIDELLRGAKEMRDATLTRDNTAAATLAKNAFRLFHDGYMTHNTFMFDERLENTGKWWRQLVGESLGKNKTTTGADSEAGIIPLVSVGSVDLHSVGQLYLSATRRIVTTFVRVTEQSEYAVPQNTVTPTGEKLSGKTLGAIKDAIFEGTMAAYKEKWIPLSQITFEGLNEYTLGQFMQLKMLEIMLLAKLMNVNAFDQPNVEDYKKVTRELLS